MSQYIAANQATHAPALLMVGPGEWKSRLDAAPDTWRNFPTPQSWTRNFSRARERSRR